MDRTLIVGPVCAGKTTYAQQLAATDQRPVIDLDQIAIELGSPVDHDHDPVTRAAAEHRFQQMILQTGPLIVVRSAPTPAERFSLARRMQAAAVLVLLTPAEVCEQRARDAGRSPDAIASIARWFERFRLTRKDRVIVP